MQISLAKIKFGDLVLIISEVLKDILHRNSEVK
jgi:hypothetical protein